MDNPLATWRMALSCGRRENTFPRNTTGPFASSLPVVVPPGDLRPARMRDACRPADDEYIAATGPRAALARPPRCWRLSLVAAAGRPAVGDTILFDAVAATFQAR
jgi:hypothetical protein